MPAQPPRTPKARPARKTLDRDSWLKKALDVLFAQGISQIKIEVLARKLKLTKGSFYWHFKNRDDLLRSMVDWWRNNQLKFIESLDHSMPDPEARIRAVIAFTQHTEDSNHDIAMREFARFNKHAARAVSEVDELRVAYLAELFTAAGFDSIEASLRARTLYFYQVGEYTTSLAPEPETRARLAERLHQLLTRHPASD
ncbi:MAG: TetR/AcrR family transcriptional regulator [Gammaproteobacteria bacterium]|nr:TetR/AcrR family transcriptional regulator [Gammaproteobacteria bacterium]